MLARTSKAGMTCFMLLTVLHSVHALSPFDSTEQLHSATGTVLRDPHSPTSKFRLQAVQTLSLGVGQHYTVGPSSGTGAATLGYSITSGSTFNVFLLSGPNYNLYINGQTFSYYTVYSRLSVTTATLAQSTFLQPQTLYLVIEQTAFQAMTCQANIGFFNGACSVTCQNGGLCSDPVTCSCASGWAGATCTSPVCSPACNPTAACTGPNTCTCTAAWTGPPACTTSACTIACQNGGVCVGANVCSCPSGWTGANCATPVCTQSCQNGGACVAPNQCSCTAQWTGATCTTPVCSPTCAQGGTCIAPNTCRCPPAWTGATCTTSACSVPCQNGGTCTGPNQCFCAPGWSGSDCSTAVCTSPCLNGGTCSAPNVCSCPPFLSGPQCDTVTATERIWFAANCDGAPTIQRTVVLDTCSPGSYGSSTLFRYNWPTAQIRRVSYVFSTSCSGQTVESLYHSGACTEYAISWRVIYTFPQPIPTCSNACENGGTCSAPNTCQCVSGWNGATCSTPVCSVACLNGGTCVAPNTCSCTSAWSGASCQISAGAQGAGGGESSSSSRGGGTSEHDTIGITTAVVVAVFGIAALTAAIYCCHKYRNKQTAGATAKPAAVELHSSQPSLAPASSFPVPQLQAQQV